MIARSLPAATLIVASVLAVLPFTVGDAARMCASFLPVMVAQYWSARRPDLLPLVLVFCCGVGIDAVTHGPIGFWALLLLSGCAVARLEERYAGRSTASGRAAEYAIAMAIVALLAWGVSSLYAGKQMNGAPLWVAALFAILSYPVLAAVFLPIDRLWSSPRPHLFARGM